MGDKISDDLQARPLAEQAVRALAEQTAEDAAERAAVKAVAHTFLLLGVDVSDPVQVRRLKENLAFIARMNRGANEVSSVIVKTCVGALVTGLLSLVVWGFVSWFQTKLH